MSAELCNKERVSVTTMLEEERDLVEFTDDEGNTLLLEVMDYFFYNGEEFAVLSDADDEEPETGCCCDACEGDCEHDGEHSLYIMKVEQSIDEAGEEIEEFSPVDDTMMDALIEIVQGRLFGDEDDDEDDDDD